MHKVRILAGLLILLPALACNLPQNSLTPAAPGAVELRQTLEAQDSQPEPTGTPLPPSETVSTLPAPPAKPASRPQGALVDRVTADLSKDPRWEPA